MAKLILYGLFTLFSVSVSVVAQDDDMRSRLVHYERTEVKPEPKTFLEVAAPQRVAWERLVEQCTPIEITQPLSESWLLLAEQYFSKEPVWPYSKMYYYDA